MSALAVACADVSAASGRFAVGFARADITPQIGAAHEQLENFKQESKGANR